LLYTEKVQEEKVKYAAGFLLLLMVLDLSSAGICSAVTFPVFDARTDVTLRSGSHADAQPVQGLDDDGCFCCCTHMLPGAHSVLASLMPAVAINSVATVLNPSAVSQAPFHPPKK
jgi:hypothetical protein